VPANKKDRLFSYPSSNQKQLLFVIVCCVIANIGNCKVIHSKSREMMHGLWNCMLEETPSGMKTEPLILEQEVALL
jgi:hypothetical protein